jgi:hypothetical protein
MRLGSARGSKANFEAIEYDDLRRLAIGARAATGTFVSYLRTTTAPSRAKERHSRHNRT